MIKASIGSLFCFLLIEKNMLYSVFAEKLQQYATANTRFVLALSGGLDSRVLLNLMGKFKQSHSQYNFQAVHIHHGLSPNADQWLTLCKTWAEQEDIEFSYQEVDVEQGPRVSLEQAARDARYQALNQYIDSNTILLTGQHATDQVETFMLALKRGSGPKGLSAMPSFAEFGEGHILRPLIDVSRCDIEAYAKPQQLTWVEDESNQDTQFDRNFIRHQITPTLKARWPNIEKTVARSALLCAQQEHLLEELLTERYQNMLANDGSISIELLMTQSTIARTALLRMWLDKQGQLMPSAKQINQIWQDVALAQSQAAPIFQYGKTRIGRHNHHLYAFAKEQDISNIELAWDINQTLELPDGLGQLLLKRANQPMTSVSETLGAKSIQSLSLPDEITSLKVVFKSAGIHAHPENRQHGRPLKKLLQEQQVPTWQRNRIPFITFGNELVAAVDLWVGKAFSGVQYKLIWLDKTR